MSYEGIALSGKAGAGKNALAFHLQVELVRRGQWSTEVGFADALKEELLREYGMRKEDPGGREKLLEIGHGRRERDPNYWVKRLAERVDSLRPYGVIPIITDLRYLSELEWARGAGFLTVRVDALPLDRATVLLTRGEDPDFVWSQHPSEVELDEARFAYRFTNWHKSMEQLRAQAYTLADFLLGQADLAA